MPRRLAALPLLLAASLLSACASAPPEIRQIAARNSSAPLWWHRIAGDYRYRIFCAEVERAGFFERRVPQGIDPAQERAYREMAARHPDRALGYIPVASPGVRLLSGVDVGSMFAPDRPGAVENNPFYRPGAPDTVNCFCWSAARREVLAVCPYNPAQGG
jgi:hypothetical protein